MRGYWLLVGAVVLATGCTSANFAPVSGKVTLDDKPLANATVVFNPVASGGSLNASIASTAKTNDKGEYKLKGSNGQSGALIGPHRVSISLLAPKVGDSDDRTTPVRGGPPLANKVPKKYNDPTELTFDVPAGGTDQADFPLSSK